ncbi:MAG: radical SAM protein [Candidatus Methanoperedens sp.]
MKNFLFVVPRFALPGQYYVFPNGLAYVISYMKHKGFNVFCLNLCHHDESIEYLLNESIKNNNIDVLCTGAMSFYWNEVNEVLETARKIKPEIVTVVGGAIITSDPRLALENMHIDFGVIGEGEETMAELADALDNGKNIYNVKGITFFEREKNLITTEHRPPILDLDSLPFPDYEGLEFDKWLSNKWIMQPSIGGLLFDVDDEQRLCEISASRSCPYQCTFCYHPLGNIYRQRSLDNVFKEIDYLVEKYNITLLNLLDELFSANEKRIYEFTDRIGKYNIRWMAQWRVNNVNEKMLKVMKDSGILMIGLGVESLNDKVLKSMKKKITKSEIERAYKLSLDVGVRACSNIILGDPEETEETINESLEWWRKHQEYDINLGFLIAVPDSQVWQYAIANNMIEDKVQFIRDKFPVINLTKLSDKKFNEIKTKVDYYVLSQKYLISGRVLTSKREAEVYNGKNIYSFRVECPTCRQISEYKHIRYTSAPYLVVLCKNCYKRVKIKTKKAYPGDYNEFAYGFMFHYAFIFYNIYLKKHNSFKGIAKILKKSLQRLGMSGYAGWLGDR